MASVFKRSRKCKRSMKEQAALMRQAKTSNVDDSEDSDDSLELPRPSDGSDEESDFEVESDDDSDDDAWAPNDSVYDAYEDWLFHLEREDKKMMALLLYDNYVDSFKLQKTAAAAEVSSLLGMSERTVRQWRKDFVSNGGEFSEYQRGKYQRYYVILDDEEYKEMAVTWVRAYNNVKESTNMTVAAFRSWVVSVLLPQVRLHHPQVPADISTRTMARWLHQLRFAPSSTKKGVYIDGHERSDVVEYRKIYLRKLEALESTHAPHQPTSDEPPLEPSDRRKLVLLFHDESTFHSNDNQGWMWAEKGKQLIKPKSQGRGIMVSDFVNKHNGYLCLEFDGEKYSHPVMWKEARYFFKIGAEDEGYWDSDKFLNQVDHSITIAELKYLKETHSLVFLFD